MSKINIRESLKHMDEDTFCKYDLTTMYDSCVLDDEDKKVLAKMLYDKEDPEVIYQKLCMYFDDDQVADIDSYLMDVPVEGKYESLINKCVNKLSENYKDVSYNDVANQLEFNNGEQVYTIGVCPFEDVDTDDYEVFIDYNYDSPCCFNSEDEALKYILNFIKNKVNHIDDSDVQNCDDEMVYTVYDIVEDDDNRLVAKCMNESTNDFEDIKLGKTNTNRVIELINNLLNNPNYKITKETKDKIYKNSAPWGLAIQMTPAVDVDGTNGLLSTGDFGGEASFGESIETNFEKDDRVTDGNREGTVLDYDSQKVLVEWDYSDTDDIEWIDRKDLNIITNSNKQVNEGVSRLKESESKTGYYHISYEKNGIYQSLIIKASSTIDAENKFKDKYSINPIGISPVESDVELDSLKRRHMPIIESSNMYFICPSCGNKTLSSIDGEVKIPADVDYHDKFICDECGEEFLSEPQFNGKIKFVYNNLNESIPNYKKNEFKKQVQDELYDTFIQLAKTPEWGFETIKEIDDFLMPVIEVNDYKGDYDNDFVAEVRGEFTYDDLEDIADSLDPIVQKYDKEAYFEPVTGGITRAYIKLDNIQESLSDRYIDKDGYVSIDDIANYITDTFDGDLDDRHDCINSLIDSFKQEGKISTEVIQQFAGAHNLTDKVIESMNQEYTDYPEVDFSFTNKRINGLPGIANERELAQKFDEVGLDKFKIKIFKLNNVSLADIKDTFGGTYFKRHYGWKAFADNNYLYVTKVPLQEDMNNDISGRYVWFNYNEVGKQPRSDEVVYAYNSKYFDNISHVELEYSGHDYLNHEFIYIATDNNGHKFRVVVGHVPTSFKESGEDLYDEVSEHLMDLIEDEVSSDVIDYYVDNFGSSFIITYNNNLDNIRNEAINLSDVLTKNGYKVRDWNTNGNNVVILRFAKPISLKEAIKEDNELITVEQEFDSAATSINSSKLPAVYSMVRFNPGDVVVDFGGGKFDNAVNYLKDQDVTLLVYDPYNRSAEHNKEVLKVLREHGGADAAVNSNVLNVIKEPEARNAVLQNIKKITKKGAPIYITVYEGTGKGNEGPTKSGYQLNRKTADYIDEIGQVFSNVKRKGKLITAINESVAESYSEDRKRLKDKIISTLEFLDTFEDIYKFPKTILGDSWDDLKSGILMGVDTAYEEIAQTLVDYLEPSVEFDKRHPELLDEDPVAAGALEEYENLKSELKESYGGAFDIEDDQYFTKEDIMDLADEVCERLYKEVHETFDVSDLYMEGNILHMELESDSCMVETDVKIDMRKIRKPLDIMKYALPITNKLLSQVKDCYNY